MGFGGIFNSFKFERGDSGQSLSEGSQGIKMEILEAKGGDSSIFPHVSSFELLDIN